MALLKENGSLDIERIDKLSLEEHMKAIGSLTREQYREYVSSLPINEGKEYTKAIKVDYSIDDERSGVDAIIFLNNKRRIYDSKV